MGFQSVADLNLAGLSSATSLTELNTALQLLSMQECRVAALKAAAIARVTSLQLFRADGHRSPSKWLRAEQNVSPATAAQQVRRAKALADLPIAAKALMAGDIGIDQADMIAALHANERCRPDLVRMAGLLTHDASRLPHSDFAKVIARFLSWADPDGTEAGFDDIRKRRRARAVVVGNEFTFSADGDTAAGGQIRAVFNAFVQAEFAKDWAHARAIHGDDVCANLLERTSSQRNFDAFHSMTLAAASSGNVKVPGPLVHYTIDDYTFQAALAKLVGEPPPTRPADYTRIRSETIDGVAVDPRQVLAEAIRGCIRRVVTDPSGLVINMGRRQRLFTAAVRDAVRQMFPNCRHPGCDVANTVCEIDHLLAWLRDGTTCPVNGDPLCPYHNRAKHRLRFTQQRQPDGTVTTHRANGTRIGRTRPNEPGSGPDSAGEPADGDGERGPP